jgi:1-pyrroline-5-carboxylate dehydrogenase
MTNTTFSYRAANEPILAYASGSTEREQLATELAKQSSEPIDIPLVINGKKIYGADTTPVVPPHAHRKLLARQHMAGEAELRKAASAASAAQKDWAQWSYEDRAAVFLRAADLLAGPWRQKLNAATMLGQSKTVHQAEIDSACELIDFLRFNVQFAHDLYSQQPYSSTGTKNRMEYRPLEGFVYAVTPFNFTAIGGNLAVAPALMGNAVVWKPASTAALSNYLFMSLLEEAGLPPGVINFVSGDPVRVTDTLLAESTFAGLHFTGSTAVFDALWQKAASNLATYRAYPRLVGETGGKDFVVAHPSADVASLSTALIRGAFEYQGQKCSAASRAYVPASIWPQLREKLVADIETIRVGDVSDMKTFLGAVIDAKAYRRITGYIARAKESGDAKLIAGGRYSDTEGYFIDPTVIEVSRPDYETMVHEIFGPVLSVFVYQDAQWIDTLRLVDQTSQYALTGAVFARDRAAIADAERELRYAAGNFYINDKPTGAVVGQQPFGGARRSGTNDKAGSMLNLTRWVSPRTIKETYVPPTDYRYPSM